MVFFIMWICNRLYKCFLPSHRFNQVKDAGLLIFFRCSSNFTVQYSKTINMTINPNSSMRKNNDGA